MVQQWTDESDMQQDGGNNNRIGNRFSYKEKRQKTDPWSTSDTENEEKSNYLANLQHHTDSKANGMKILNPKLNAIRSDFDFESVWSVRKNVPLPTSKKQPSTQITTKTTQSYYSRHAGGYLGNHQSKESLKKESHDSNNSTSSWSLSRPGYSYAGQGSIKRQADAVDDDDDEFSFNETKTKHSRNESSNRGNLSIQSPTSNKGSLSSVINPVRKGSARTQRAQKMHNAYLRSAGLGDFTPSGVLPRREEDSSDN